MVDQFASYAKVQRKINALSQQYKDKGSVVYGKDFINHKYNFSSLPMVSVYFVCILVCRLLIKVST